MTITLGIEEAQLISRALDLYSRVGMLQFNYLTDCYSLQKLVWDKDISEDFKVRADALKALFGYTSNSNPGIFNTEVVQDDCRIAAHIHQQIRHKLYLDRGEKSYTVDSYPADICDIAKIPLPKFKIK